MKLSAAQKRHRRAWRLTSAAYKRSGISPHLPCRLQIVTAFEKAIFERLKREEELLKIIVGLKSVLGDADTDKRKQA